MSDKIKITREQIIEALAEEHAENLYKDWEACCEIFMNGFTGLNNESIENLIAWYGYAKDLNDDSILIVDNPKDSTI